MFICQSMQYNMASKKASKVKKFTKPQKYNILVLNDVLCPICRSILIEPVSLPCSHSFCLFCFEGTMENANLVCPLCRLRVGSWLRKVRKENVLVNGDLWNTIKEQFSQHVNNKLSGVDENFEEKREIIVSYPGEIRKEYEIQKQKEDSELNKQRETELKASEELIKKLKQEEEYHKAVMEEKLKVDEELAKKLAAELSSNDACTSSVKTNKKLGPMDKFIKKDNETSDVLNPNNFLNKEYTCRVLCLDRKSSTESFIKESSPKIHKKIKQLQKIVDLDTTSDGSDCIESEMRYFKPIDYRLNPPSQWKSPLKVIARKLPTDINANRVSPNGLVSFCSNILESAFARFQKDLPILPKLQSNKKRTISPQNFITPDKKMKSESKEKDKKSPKLNSNFFPRARKSLFTNNIDLKGAGVESPPFYGFDRKSKIQNNKTNGNLLENTQDIINLRKEQEEADLQFAKNLQEEFNRCHYTRSSRNLLKRQTTIDELIKSPYRVK